MRTLDKFQVVSHHLLGLDLHGAFHWEGCARKNVSGHLESVRSDFFTFLFLAAKSFRQ